MLLHFFTYKTIALDHSATLAFTKIVVICGVNHRR